MRKDASDSSSTGQPGTRGVTQKGKDSATAATQIATWNSTMKSLVHLGIVSQRRLSSGTCAAMCRRLAAVVSCARYSVTSDR